MRQAPPKSTHRPRPAQRHVQWIRGMIQKMVSRNQQWLTSIKWKYFQEMNAFWRSIWPIIIWQTITKVKSIPSINSGHDPNCYIHHFHVQTTAWKSGTQCKCDDANSGWMAGDIAWSVVGYSVSEGSLEIWSSWTLLLLVAASSFRLSYTGL